MKTERISIATCYDVAKEFDSDKFIKIRLRLCHDGKNPAGSNFTTDSLKNAGDSIKNVPILAYVVADKDKTLDFKAHDMAYEKNIMSDDDNELKLIYKEQPIGVIPEDNNYSVEEVDGRTYAFADGYIWKDYSNYAQDIIERDGTKNLSMEAIIDELDVDAETNDYVVTNFRYKGVTLLGDDVKTGMLNAKATVETFGADIYEQITQMITELNFALDNQKKEVNNEMNDETKVTEMEAGATATFADNTSSEDTSAPVAENNDASAVDTENFALSHEQIRCQLYRKLRENAIDGWIGDVYDTEFIYKPYCEGDEPIEFKQLYSVVDDEVVFNGEPIKLYIERVTAEEKAQLDAAREGQETELNELKASLEAAQADKLNLSAELEALKTENLALAEFKQSVEKAQADAAREAVVTKWSTVLANNAEFSALISGDMSEFSAEDLEVKCKVIFADANAKFSAEPTKPENNVVRFSVSDSSNAKDINEPYGGLFAEYGINK